MIFAKPPGGFKWVETDRAQSQLQAIFAHDPELEPQWQAIRELLIHTGHRDGSRLTQTEESNVYLFRASQAGTLPDIQLIYTLLGDTLTVRSVRTKGGI